MADEEENVRDTLMFLGKDLTKIPCFKNTFLYSSASYVGVGLLTFLFTSKPALSSHVGFASFLAVTFGYYVQCRIRHAQLVFNTGHLQQAMQMMATLEGTEKSNMPKENPKITEEA